MKVTVASGKGGTGKTTVSASLISVWPGPAVAVDLDVEEPNLHLFLHPEISGQRNAFMEIPKADESLCSRCGQCSDLCQFKAISLMGEVLMLFPEMCHGCGGCISICPEGALSADVRLLGDVSWGHSEKGDFIMGRLRIGEAMSPPLMRAVKARLEDRITASPADVIIDAPPGVSCPAVNAVMDSDMILLVTEPTPFGVYDMKLAHQAFAPMKKPMGVVVNRAGMGNSEIYDYCKAENLEILAEIPYDRRIAEDYANGCIIADTSEPMRQLFTGLAEKIRQKAGREVSR
ncbi:MAG: (4Fe-4S)-binding protein [Desulfobacteraceae bacterium]|nr:MAG: (4Fe-4S)-binding protein [Desulfobacteraceae bacterium]